jgi:hypothetical protein
MSDIETPQRPRAQRSPSYPAIDLEEALRRTRELWNVAKRHPAQVGAVQRAWGYGPKSSGGKLALAALKKFGLIEDEGSKEARRVRVSRLGQELLMHSANPESSEYRERLQRAALTPTIHQELWREYGGEIPDDSVVAPQLVLDRNFSEGGARELLRNYRRTLAFAGLPGADASLSENGEDEIQDLEEEPPDLAPKHHSVTFKKATSSGKGGAVATDITPQGSSQVYRVKLVGGSQVAIQLPEQMSEESWEHLLDYLNVLKRGIVQEPGAE